MLTLKRLSLLAVALLVAAGLGLSASPRAARAQDDMMKVACDSDLILSLFTAEYHFEFAAVHNAMMGEGMELVDLAAFEKGQFAPLFDSMMGMMSDDMSMGMMDEDTMQGLLDALAMDPAAMESAMMEMGGDSMMAALVAPVVEGEAPECTALRDELRHFYTALAYNTQMMSQGM